jgi:hypothetical protein
MIKKSQAELVQQLEAEGFSFLRFSLSHEGQYAAEDADWNYSDVPHLEYVHKLVDGITSTIADDFLTAVLLQRVLGFRVPLAHTEYQIGPSAMVYYTAFAFLVLIIETSWEELAPLRTRVVTTYCIGGPRLLSPLFPFVKRVLTKNYHALMADDIPMRERRGQLRSWGYGFLKDTPRYTFPYTMLIGRNNVVAPPNVTATPHRVVLDTALPADGSLLLGRPDHLGLRVIREGSQLLVTRRMCPHEGAALDQATCKAGRLSCPWHGRVLPPLASFDLSASEDVRVAIQHHQLCLSRGVLSIDPLALG